MQRPYFSLIITTFNEGLVFESNVRKIVASLDKLKKEWEIVFVEDKSTDNTKNSVQKLATQFKNTQAIYHKANKGRGQSVSDGIKASRGEICGFVDVDCEISPRYIPQFIAQIEKGKDFVVAKRIYEQNFNSFYRVVASKAYSLIVHWLLNLPLTDTEAGYKFFNRKKILPIIAHVKDERWFWDTEICALSFYKGLKVDEIPVQFVRRRDKKSTVRLIPDSASYFLKLIEFRLRKVK